MYDYKFDKITEPWQSYILGLIYADGSISDSTVYFSCAIKDKEWLQTVKEKLGNFRPWIKIPAKVFEYKGRKINGTEGCRFCLYSKEIINNLKKLGLMRNKSQKIRFPKIPFIYDFIRGYFDGDGSISIKDNGGFIGIRVSILSNEEFLKGIKETFGYGRIHLDKGIGVYYIQKFSEIKDFYARLYSGECELFLKRKKDRFEESIKNKMVEIAKLNKEKLLIRKEIKNIKKRNKSSYKKDKKVMCYDLDFKLVSVYSSYKEAAEKLSIYKNYIRSCCAGERISSFGFIWTMDESFSISKNCLKYLRSTAA